MTGDDNEDRAGGEEEDLTAPNRRRRQRAITPPELERLDIKFDLARALAAPGAYSPAECARFALNELGLAQRFIVRHGRDCLYADGQGWAVFDGACFAFAGGESAVLLRMQETNRAIGAEIEAIKAERPRKRSHESQDSHDIRLKLWSDRLRAHERFQTASGNYDRMKKALAHACALLRTPVRDLNRDPWLLATPNATLVLGPRTVTARGPDRADRITRCTTAVWDPNADTSPIEAFVARVLPDPGVRHFLHKALGYALSGEMKEQACFFLLGDGANGKSSLLEMVRGALGGFAVHVPFAVVALAQRQSNPAAPDLARLPGARFLTMSEPRSGDTIDESVIKGMTGGDPMTVRALYQEPFEFTPTHKCFIAMNLKPGVPDDSHGAWRRIRLIPFTERLNPNGPDAALRAAALAPEARSAVLLWLVNGLELYLAEGLDPPAAVLAETEGWRSDVNPVPAFLASVCTRETSEGPDAPRTPAGHLYAAYRYWAKESGVPVISQARFGKAMAAAGIAKTKSSTMVYTGLALEPAFKSRFDAHLAQHGRDT